MQFCFCVLFGFVYTVMYRQILFVYTSKREGCIPTLWGGEGCILSLLWDGERILSMPCPPVSTGMLKTWKFTSEAVCLYLSNGIPWNWGAKAHIQALAHHRPRSTTVRLLQNHLQHPLWGLLEGTRASDRKEPGTDLLVNCGLGVRAHSGFPSLP